MRNTKAVILGILYLSLADCAITGWIVFAVETTKRDPLTSFIVTFAPFVIIPIVIAIIADIKGCKL